MTQCQEAVLWQLPLITRFTVKTLVFLFVHVILASLGAKSALRVHTGAASAHLPVRPRFLLVAPTLPTLLTARGVIRGLHGHLTSNQFILTLLAEKPAFRAVRHKRMVAARPRLLQPNAGMRAGRGRRHFVRKVARGRDQLAFI